MSKFNKRDFDEQFEAFLKESVSSEDGSIDSSSINRFFEPSRKKKEQKPWWLDDDDDGSKTGGSVGGGKSFLKKKAGPVSSKLGGGPMKQNGNNKQRGQKPKREMKGKVKPRKTDASISKDSLEDISEKSEDDAHEHRPRVHLPDSSYDTTRDSIDTQDLLEPTSSPAKPGMDTLDELADKEKFFRDLENQAEGTIDYGRLNQELSQTGNTMSPAGAARTAATLAALEDMEDYSESERPSAPEPTPYSEAKTPSEHKPSMLSQVSLMDSLDSTMNTTTSPQIGRGTLQEADVLKEEDEEDMDSGPIVEAPETFKTGGTGGTGFIGTNTSQEIEALHKALREVGMSGTLMNDSQLLESLQGDKDTADLVQKLLRESGKKSGKQRNVEEILKELEELQRKTESGSPPSGSRSPRIERQQHVYEDAEEVRGFALSPVRRSYQNSPGREDSHSHTSDTPGRGFDHSHTEDTEMYQPVTQVSVTERGRKKKKEPKKEQSKVKKKFEVEEKEEKGKKPERSRDARVRRSRSRSDSPNKLTMTGTATLRAKLMKVKSSGYGVKSPAKIPRDTSKEDKKDMKTKDVRRSASRSPRRAQDFSKRSPPKTFIKETEKRGESWSPADVTRQKVIGTVSPKQMRPGGGPVLDAHLEASVESFTNYIKNHFTNRAAPEIKYSQDEPSVSASWKGDKQKETGDNFTEWRSKYEQERQLREKAEADLAYVAQEYKKKMEAQRLDFDQEIFKLKQENFALHARVETEGKEDIKSKVLQGTLEGVSKDQMSLLEKEIKEQETLIAGYEQENKRLYNEMRNVQKQNKQAEERMFKENQKLIADLTNLRTQLERKDEELKNRGIITSLAIQQDIAAGKADSVGPAVMAQLESRLREAQSSSDALQREIKVLQGSNIELEKHVDKLVKEREELRKKVEEARTLKSEEAQDLENKYKEEIERLKKKVKWYVENQEMLDKGTKRLRDRDDEIHKLKMRIEELKTESGKRMEDNKSRARERAADARKIQDLQRQVKEMEQILKRRHPNALPTLMMAAAAAEQDLQKAESRTPYMEVLEKRVKKLEGELDTKDEESERMLRGVEQKYNSIKLQFEERIKDLELQLSIYQGQADHVHPHTHAVALERELESVRERYKKQVSDLQAEVDRLAAEIIRVKKSQEGTLKSELQTAKEAETELRSQVKSLQIEVENKSHDIQVLQKSLERLRKEKHTYMMNGLGAGEMGKRAKGRGKSKKDDNGETEFMSLPDRPGQDREYEPQTFADETHISDVIRENEELKMKVDQLQLHLDQQRVDLRKSLAETEAVFRKSREDYEDKIEKLRTSHQRELQRILAEQALEHSASRTAELQGKVDTQEVLINHLKHQLSKTEVEAETASILRIQLTALETKYKKLEEELIEAKRSHTPAMRHFESLESKILSMENKHSTREQELQQIIKNAQHTASVELEREVRKWKNIVETKNAEINKFRVELDSILEVLRVLQKQGVIIPVGGAVS